MSKIVALEIADQSIRAVEIANYKNPKKAKLLKTAEFKIRQGIAGESQVFDQEGLSDALKEFWTKEKFSTRSVGVIASGRRFIVRPHTTIYQSMANVRKMLPLESNGALPDQVENLLYDFFPVEQVTAKNGSPMFEGLVISSPIEAIEELATSLQRAKLNLEFVEFSPLGITRWLKRNGGQPNYALVNIRDESTDVAIVKDGMPRIIRVLAKGLESSKRNLGRHGVRESPLSTGDFDSPSELLARDVEMTLRSQDNELIGSITTIYTSGPRAEDPELIAMLKESFGLSIEPLSIESIAETETVDEELNLKPSFDEFVAMCGGIR